MLIDPSRWTRAISGARLFLVLLCAAMIYATSEPVQAGVAALAGQTCTTPGVSAMNQLQTEILACLYNPNNPNQLIWWRAETAGVNLNAIPTCGVNAVNNQMVLNFCNVGTCTDGNGHAIAPGNFYCFTP